MELFSDFLKPSQINTGSTSLPSVTELLCPAMDGLSEQSNCSIRPARLLEISDLHKPYSGATISSDRCALVFDELKRFAVFACLEGTRLRAAGLYNDCKVYVLADCAAMFIVPGCPRMTRSFT